MTSRAQFVTRLAAALNEDVAIVQEDTELDRLIGWDSVGQLSVIALIDECFNVRVQVDTLRKCQSVHDLLRLIASELDGKPLE